MMPSPATESPGTADARRWSIRLPTGYVARWTLAVGVLLAVSTWAALRQPSRPDPMQPVRLFSWDWWRYPVQRNAFVEPVIRSDLQTVFPLPDGRTIWAGGSGGLLIVSRDAGRSWDTAAVYGPANWEAITAPRLNTEDTTVVSPVPPDTLQGQSVLPAGDSIAALSSPQTSFLAEPAAARMGTHGVQGPVAVLLRAAGALAGPATLHAQIRGPAPVPAARRIRLVGTVADIFFLNATMGWAVTEWGDVLVTRDGGARWDVTPQVTGDVYGVRSLEFADSLRGMISTLDAIMSTTDGGRTWVASLRSDDVILGHLVAGAVGYAVARTSSALWRTDDAGASWRAVPRPGASTSRVVGAYFRDARSGWMSIHTGGRTALYKTSNGAQSWQIISNSSGIIRILPLRPGGPLIAVAGEEEDIPLHSADGVSWDTLQLPMELSSLGFLGTGADGRLWGAGENGAVIVSPDSGRRWQNVTGGRSLLATAFVDPSHGWAVGRAGTILVTRDGGQSWFPQTAGTQADLLAVAFRNAVEGWAVGVAGTVVRTRDGGRTWNRERISGIAGAERLEQVQFADSLNGWISADGTLLRTTDGGRTWQRHAIPRRFFSHIHFTDARNGWVSTLGSLHRTRDGGVTWDTVTVPTRFPMGFGSVWFANDSVGWLSRGNTVHATRDGGRTWQKQRLSGAEGINQLHFVDERTGYAVGANGAVYRTVNGGAQWQRDSVPTTRDLFGIAAVGSRAWAVGAGGAVVRRSEAGQWQAVRTTTAPAPWFYLVCSVLAMSVMVAVRRSAEQERTAAARSAASVETLLISDRPLQPGDPDPFDLNSLALGVSKFLRNPRTRPPLTLAITGRWGTGKSSLMNLIRRDLEANRFRPVWFNAWHHQKEEHLLAALLESIRAQAVPRWLSPAGIAFRLRLFWVRVKRHRPSAIFVCIAAAALLGYLASDLDRVATLWTSVRRTVINPVGAGKILGDRLAANFRSTEGGSAIAYIALIAATSAAALWRAFRAFGVKPAALMASLISHVRLRDLQQQTGFRHQFAREFSEVTEALHPMDMVLFVDDLDRCRPEQVLEVLESINFLVSSGDCVVVMGMDREWVIRCVGLAFDQIAQESAILSAAGVGGPAPSPGEPPTAEEQKRSNRGEFARHYLEKLVNIEIPVPVPTPRQLRGLVQFSGTERREQPRQQPTLRTTGLRYLKDPRTARYAVYLAVGIVVFTGSFLRFRPGAAPVQDTFVVEGPATALAETPPDSTRAVPQVDSTAAPAPQRGERPGELVGAPPAERVLVGPAAALLALLLVMGVALLRRQDALVQDSRTFTSALGAWSGVIASRGFTPRITKKFLNRLRYYAMRQRALEPPQSPALRLSRTLRRFWAAFRPVSETALDATAPGGEGVQEERRASAQVPIPEPILVALACLHECHPDGTPQAAYEDFHHFVRSSPLTSEFSAEILAPELEYPRSLARYRRRFEEISAGVRIH